MQTTSHTRMRTRTIPTEDGRGCIRPNRPGRANDRRRGIAESIGRRY